jgi:hypothetical protein
MLLRLVKFLKDFLLASRLMLLLKPINHLFGFLYHFTKLTYWVQTNSKKFIKSDFYTPYRDYSKRPFLYKDVMDHYNLASNPVHYFEFGVASGVSFKWWLENNRHADSQFFGFDTFEGLPENWGGFYQKGAMSHGIPDISDERAKFYKGLFQDTLVPFIEDHQAFLKLPVRKVIHLDADLFTATLFTLSQLYPYLNKGDILIYDEFSVANHEFKAMDLFQEVFYVKCKPVFAQNNFYQVAFEIQ